MNELLDSIPTAEHARERINKMQDARTEAEVARVSAALNRAIEQGQREVMVEPFSSLVFVQHLKEKGYSVRHRRTGPNESGIEISW